jgi:hypothetical protein
VRRGGFSWVQVFGLESLRVGAPGVSSVSEGDFLVSGRVPFFGFVREEGADKSDPLFVECFRVKPEVPENGLPPGTERSLGFSVVVSWLGQLNLCYPRWLLCPFGGDCLPRQVCRESGRQLVGEGSPFACVDRGRTARG